MTKVHHCMVDGVSGAELLAAVLDFQPDADLPAEQPWVADRSRPTYSSWPGR